MSEIAREWRKRRFMEALDERLLEIATSGVGAVILSIPEYEAWQQTHKLRHVVDKKVLAAAHRALDDAVAGAFQETCRGLPQGEYWELYHEIRHDLGLPDRDLSLPV